MRARPEYPGAGRACEDSQRRHEVVEAARQCSRRRLLRRICALGVPARDVVDIARDLRVEWDLSRNLLDQRRSLVSHESARLTPAGRLTTVRAYRRRTPNCACRGEMGSLTHHGLAVVASLPPRGPPEPGGPFDTHTRARHRAEVHSPILPWTNGKVDRLSWRLNGATHAPGPRAPAVPWSGQPGSSTTTRNGSTSATTHSRRSRSTVGLPPE